MPNKYLQKAAFLKPEFSLRGHQESAAETAVRRNGNLLLSHPVGSGKTLTSIATFEKLADKGIASRALVVTPASLRENYGENGVSKFTDQKYVIYGNKQEITSDKTSKYVEPGSSDARYGIVSYELFRENPEKYIKGHNADTVIFDEIHKIKNDSSLTYKALKESRRLFRNFIGMTGSIVSNSPSDIVPLVDAMTQGNHRLGSKASFENRFVDRDKEGNKKVNNPLMVKVLLAPYVHHVAEETIHSSVGAPPKKIVNEINVQMDPVHQDFYRYAIKDLDPLTKLKMEYGLGKLSNSEKDALFSKLLKARQVSNGMHMLDNKMSLSESAKTSTKVRRLLGDVQEHLSSVPDAQVVVHSELLQGGMDVLEQGLKDRNIEYAKFIGKGNKGITEASRQQGVQEYNEGKKKVILISSAGGEGLDLPNTTMVASLDGHWNPEKINQVEARGIRLGGQAHRPEKDRKVIVNRYRATLPVNKTEFAIRMWQNISPERILERLATGGPAFLNPLAKPKTVDVAMYETAAQKAKGNEQLKSLFKQAKFHEFISDKDIMLEYLNKYQDRLLSGDYQNSRVDEEENQYITRLRKYYEKAKGDKVNRVTNPKEFEKLRSQNKLKTILTEVVKPSLQGALAGAGLQTMTGTTRYGEMIGNFIRDKTLPTGGELVAHAMGPAIVGGMTAYNQIKNLYRPTVTSSPSTARTYSKFSDEDLLKLLRGESVEKQEVKTKSHYIKLK